MSLTASSLLTISLPIGHHVVSDQLDGLRVAHGLLILNQTDERFVGLHQLVELAVVAQGIGHVIGIHGIQGILILELDEKQL